MEELKNLLKQYQGNSEHTYDPVRHAQLLCDTYNHTQGALSGHECDKCKNKGYYMTVQNADAVMVECPCLKIRRSLWRIEKSGMKGLAERCTFDNFIVANKWQENMKNLVMSYSDNPNGKWLFIGGQSGTGKTHLCTAAAVKLIKSGMSGIYMLWRDDSTRLKAAVTDDFDYQHLMKLYKECDLLYIDDFFKGKWTDADIKIAYEIINRRSYENRITIISSELLLEEFLNIDEATGGRIREKCGEYLINISKDTKKNYRLL